MVMMISKKQFLIVLCLLFSYGFLSCYIADATAQPIAGNIASLAGDTPGTPALSKKDDTFAYRFEGRLDPFMPFISDKVESNLDPNEIVEDADQLTGMQLFEPGQLTLVALVESQDQKFAMVEDVTGKGYIIKEGTKVGRRGVVRSIVPNKVLIEEIAVTRAGKKLTSDIVMVLRKEEKKK
jgi:hypothetical protein